MQQTDIFNVKDKLPDVGRGSFLVYAPKNFPKNSRWLVAEYKEDVKGFYSESSEIFLDDVTHWCKLPDEPKPMAQNECTETEIIEELTPIELPSNEEINERSYYDKDNDKLIVNAAEIARFRDGAKWLRDKILNQNK